MQCPTDMGEYEEKYYSNTGDPVEDASGDERFRRPSDVRVVQRSGGNGCGLHVGVRQMLNVLLHFPGTLVTALAILLQCAKDDFVHRRANRRLARRRREAANGQFAREHFVENDT